MTADEFVDQYLDLGEKLRCPLIPLRGRCEAASLTIPKVLAAIRNRYGNGSWMETSRLVMPDGSRPRGYEGFAFRDMPARLPPTVAKIWSRLPYRGPASEFPLTPHQLAGASKSHRIAMVRENDGIWVVRDIDPDYDDVLTKAKRQRCERQKRQNRRYDPETQKNRPLPPMTQAIWPHLPYRGKVGDFPIKVSIHQLWGACKGSADRRGRLAMVSRNDDIWIVRDIDVEYDRVRSLGKDRRAWDEDGSCNDREERDERWTEYQETFPHRDERPAPFAPTLGSDETVEAATNYSISY